MVELQDYFRFYRGYSKQHTTNEDVLTFTKIISISNTQVNELRCILKEYKNVFSNIDEVEEYIRWIEQNDG